jgi:hypothetical protein
MPHYNMSHNAFSQKARKGLTIFFSQIMRLNHSNIKSLNFLSQEVEDLKIKELMERQQETIENQGFSIRENVCPSGEISYPTPPNVG